MSKHSNVKPIYKFIVFPGNNHQLIKKALAKRKNWQEIEEQQIFDANFIWKPLNLSTRIYHQIDQKLKFEASYQVLINHFESNSLITTKSGLTRSLKYFYSHQQNIFSKNYHVFESIPTTFIVQAHKETVEYKSFTQRFRQIQKKNFTKQKMPQKHCQNNVWIVKPQAENQGRGIQLFKNFKEIESFLISKPVHTNWIIQKCIQRPLLYYGRKFDVRMWVLVSPQFQIYYYKKAYMRTSSYEYDCVNLGNVVQLTNNCFQKKTEAYSKHEQGNTLPIEKLQEYLNQHEKFRQHNIDIEKSIIIRMKDLILDSILCAKKNLYKQKRQKQFELFGYDFLIDEDLRTWLLEVNNNPYLGIPNNYIKNLLPLMVDQMFEIVLDPMFPPAEQYEKVQERNFTLIYNEMNFSSRKLRNQRSLSKNYYPLGMSSTERNRSIAKISKTQDHLQSVLGTQRQSARQKYSTPSQTIKFLLETYYYSDYEPYELPASMILNSLKLFDINQQQANLKSIKLITETRICPILLESKFLEISIKILLGEYSEKIKSTLLNGYVNAIKLPKDRKKVIQTLLAVISENLIDKLRNKKQIDNEYLTNSIKLIITLGGVFQRRVFIPGETRENQYVREYFIRQNGLLFLFYVAKLNPQICKNQIVNFFSTLQDRDWQIFKATSKVQQGEFDAWQKKYKGNSIIKEKNNVKDKRVAENNITSVIQTIKAEIKFEELQFMYKNKLRMHSGLTTPNNLMKARKSLVLGNSLSIKQKHEQLPSIKIGRKHK